VKSLYDEPAYYAMMFDQRSDDVAFYRAVVARAKARSVLEYGAGAGRVAIPLARDGVEVDAVESAPAMVRALRERLGGESADVRARVRVTEGDALAVTLSGRADAVISPFNGLAHFERAEQLEAFFGKVHEHLEEREGAVFAFDVWIPAPGLLAGAETRSPWLDDPRGVGRVRCTERFAYESLTQVLVARLEIRDERGGVVDVLETRLRQFFPEETRTLLAHHGFEVVHRTARFAGTTGVDSFGPALTLSADESDRGEMLAYVCRPKRRRSGAPFG
jgi:SAM-dependent methyltransferase